MYLTTSPRVVRISPKKSEGVLGKRKVVHKHSKFGVNGIFLFHHCLRRFHDVLGLQHGHVPSSLQNGDRHHKEQENEEKKGKSAREKGKGREGGRMREGGGIERSK